MMKEVIVKPSQASEAVKLAHLTKVPCLLSGPPAVGKSAIIHSAARDLGIAVIDIRLALRDAVDLLGVPRVEGGLTRWSPPAELPRVEEHGEEGFLFLDELAQAPTAVQNASLSLLLDRFVGEYKLPAGWTVVAASNRVEDRAGAGKTTTAVNSRVTHYEMMPDLGDWCRWAMGPGNIRVEVVSFLRFRPDFLHKFDPKSTEKPFPAPRTWERVSRYIDAGVTKDMELPAFSGTVGREATAEFTAFLRVFRSLPSLDNILMNPGSAPIPEEASAKYAVATGLARRVSSGNIDAVVTYGRRLGSEFQALMVRDINKKHETLATNTRSFATWMANLNL